MRIYTDGSYNIDKDIGAWAIITEEGEIHTGVKKHTDIFEMESYAVLEAITLYKGEEVLDIFTDNLAVVRMIQNPKEKYNNKHFTINEINKLIGLMGLDVRLHKVKSHQHPMNIKADTLAKQRIHKEITSMSYSEEYKQLKKTEKELIEKIEISLREIKATDSYVSREAGENLTIIWEGELNLSHIMSLQEIIGEIKQIKSYKHYNMMEIEFK